MLLSYVRKLFEPRPSIVMPLSRIPIIKHMPFEPVKRKKVTGNLKDQKNKVKVIKSHNNILTWNKSSIDYPFNKNDSEVNL